jgi:hypothetical protein
MIPPPLKASELELVLSVLRQHLSRAKSTHTPRSDVDLALVGSLGALDAEAIAAELEDLPPRTTAGAHRAGGDGDLSGDSKLNLAL